MAILLQNYSNICQILTTAAVSKKNRQYLAKIGQNHKKYLSKH
jgi:hypothetical protein